MTLVQHFQALLLLLFWVSKLIKNIFTILFLMHVYILEIITDPQNRLIPVGSTVSLTCTSSVSSGVTFSWTHAGSDVTGQSTSTGNTSILTIPNVMRSDAGSYVCTVRSGSLSVMSDRGTLTIYGKWCLSMVINVGKARAKSTKEYILGKQPAFVRKFPTATLSYQ